MSSRSAWPDEYYEALRFYYWEPQWLNRHAGAVKGENRVEQVIKGLRAAEVSLNHILNIFFSLAPSAMTARFLAASLVGWAPERVETQISPKQSVDPKIDLCQIDILFEGTATRVALELKIGAKAPLDQVIKYALFLRYYGEHDGAQQKKPYLLYISPCTAALLDGGLAFSDVPSALEGAKLKPTVTRFAKACGLSRPDVISLAAALPISQTTYEAFGAFLYAELGKIDATEGGETLGRLIGGLLAEMTARKLTA